MSTYLLSRREDGTVERDRLVLLERFHDPFTVRQLDAIGVGPGWSCLDAVAGSGSVTRMLAERVTPTGSVLAIGLDTRLLEPLASNTIEIRRRDLLDGQRRRSCSTA